MGTLHQLRPVNPMFEDISEADVVKEINVYLTNMSQTLARVPSGGELELVLSLNASVATLVRSMQIRRNNRQIRKLEDELKMWTSALQEAETLP
jgi:hypothetical protein